MSRLDSFIRRMKAQRSIIEYAVSLINNVEGPILELGLGSARTYDHFRKMMPNRDIFAFDNGIFCPPGYVPDAHYFILGEIEDTLKYCGPRVGGKAALIHNDLGSGETTYNLEVARWLTPLIDERIGAAGIVMTSFELELTDCEKLPTPDDVPDGRYHLYRRR